MMARTWSALFALGAGLMHLGLGSAIVSAPADAGTTLVLSALILLGVLEIVWGIVVLALDRPWASTGRPWLVYVGVALGVLAMVMGGFALDAGAPTMAVAASGLLIVVAAVTSVIGWRRARSRRTEVRRRPGLEFAGLAVAAVLVAGIVTPAVAGTSAGLHAVPHDHGGGLVESGHQH
jgi:hypothetical protein